MPTYTYRCQKCGEEFERFQSMSDEPVKRCPTCKGKVQRTFHPVGIVLKGSGFHRNDYRTPAKSGSNESKDKSETKAETKSESKPADSKSSDSKPSEKSSKSTIQEGMTQAEIGVFGGSGFYSFVDGLQTHTIDTPYGAPSAPVATGTLSGRKVAFLPRHGSHHELPPHAINYRANLWAFKELGVTRVLAPTAAGSLQAHVQPGDVVICDQLVDRTSGRVQTFYDGPLSVHVSFADPYCDELRPLAGEAARAAGITVHDSGTVVVIEGPRFATRAESTWYQSQGWEVINMTQYPEAYLARELEMCYVNLSLITDYDVGVEGRPEVAPVTMEEALRVFGENVGRLRQSLFELIERVPRESSCACGDALKGTPARP